MEIIHTLAETLNIFSIHVLLFFQKFFHLNFTFVSSILKCVQDFKEGLLEHVLPVLKILHCYYQDLILFQYEVVDIIQFSINLTINIFHDICIKIIYGINNFTDLIYTVYQSIICFFTFLQNSVLQTYELIIYLIYLIFDSLLLILQLVPNLLIFLFDISKACFYYLLDILLSSALSVAENALYVSSRCTEAVLSIPVKAYIGALLLAVLFHQYRIILKYLKAYFALWILILVEVGNYLIYVALICLKPVSAVTVSTCKIFKHILFSENTLNNEENSPVNSERNPYLVQSFNLCKKYTLGVKKFFMKYLIRGKYADEQIEQLQKELLAEREKNICIICFDRPRSIVIHPCHHMCICKECSSNWFTGLQRCPLCRQIILDVHSVYT